jgi:hypothetical protein
LSELLPELPIVRITRSLLLTPIVAGCYSYTTIAPTTAPTGIEVRARITGAASDRVAPLLGSFDTRELTGNVVENRGGELLLDVPLGTRPNVQTPAGPLHTRVPLAASDVLQLEQRKLDVGRTSMLVGGILAGIGVGVAVALRSGGESEQGKGPPEPPPIDRIPVGPGGRLGDRATGRPGDWAAFRFVGWALPR